MRNGEYSRVGWMLALVLLLAPASAGCSGDDDEGDVPGDGTAGRRSGPGAGPGFGNSGPWSPLDRFPGSGTSDAGDPLPNGMVCDYVPGAPSPIPEAVQECYYDVNDPNRDQPAAILEQVLECVEGVDAVHLRLTFHPTFVDNTYGANAVGWSDEQAAMMEPPMMPPPMMGMGGKAPKPPKGGKGGHTFMDLVGSDHAEILVKDDNGDVVVHFKLDYLSQDAASDSGYGSLGVLGGEGKMLVGNPAHVVQWTTSQDRNMNERGYADYTTDSPATDASYTPNSETPEWDYRVVYEAWIDLEAFGDVGFGGATIEFVHASPSKGASNTIEVVPGDCPPCPDNDPDADCGETPPPPPPPPPGCIDLDPDTFCGEAGAPSAGNGGNGGSAGSGTAGNGGDQVEYCQEHPEDPTCMVD